MGKFPDTVGLSYRCGALEGHTGPDGDFLYLPGEDVAFSIGSLELGTTRGKPLVTVVDLVDDPSLTNSKLLNIARLLFTLAPGLGFEKPSHIGERVSLNVPPILRSIGKSLLTFPCHRNAMCSLSTLYKST